MIYRSAQALPVAGLAAVVVLAIGLRLVPILLVPSMVWPDEVFQTSEQAHRLVYGTGLVPWEFQFGIRSWLLPGIIAIVMELSRIVGEGPDYYLPAIAGAFAALAATPVVCCFLWSRRLFGLSGALVAGTATAVAPELVYFGARTLSEVVAGHLLIAGLYTLDPGYPATSRRRLVAGGALLAIVLVLRVQLAPAVVIAALWANLRSARVYALPTLAGVTAGLIAAGTLDALTLGYPLASLWRYVLYNAYYGVSSTFGVEPGIYYLQGELEVWSSALPFLLLLLALGAKRMPGLMAAAVTIIAVHSMIGHKEYRFIYPATLLLMVLAGVGLAQIVSWGQNYLKMQGNRGNIAASSCVFFSVGFWCFVSYRVWTGPTLTALRDRAHDNLSAAAFVSHGPAACGIGLYGAGGKDWLDSGGYTHFHLGVPLFWPKDENALLAAAVGFNTLVYTQASPSSLGFNLVKCFGQVCVARRAGNCRALPGDPMPVPAPLTSLERETRSIPGLSQAGAGVARSYLTNANP
jgi:GPI mannosyltransferase 3